MKDAKNVIRRAATIIEGAVLLSGIGIGNVAHAQDAAAGGKVFARCQACHQVDPARGSGLGPNLAGIVGRKAGTLPRFNFSPAMAKSGIVWDKAKLDVFLAAPQKSLPGSRMAFAGLVNPKDRADVIAFLATK